MSQFTKHKSSLEIRISSLRAAIRVRKALSADTRLLEERLASLQMQLVEHLRSRPSLVGAAH